MLKKSLPWVDLCVLCHWQTGARSHLELSHYAFALYVCTVQDTIGNFYHTHKCILSLLNHFSFVGFSFNLCYYLLIPPFVGPYFLLNYYPYQSFNINQIKLIIIIIIINQKNVSKLIYFTVIAKHNQEQIPLGH